MAEKPPSPWKRSPRKYVKKKDAASPQGDSGSSDDKNLSDMTQNLLQVHTEEEFLQLSHPTGHFRAGPISPLDAPSETWKEGLSAKVMVESTSPPQLLPSSPTAATPTRPSANLVSTRPVIVCSQCDPRSLPPGTNCPHVAQASRCLDYQDPPPDLPPRPNRHISGAGYRVFAVELASDVSAGQTVPLIVARCVELVDDWCSVNKTESTTVYCYPGTTEEIQEIQAMFAAGNAKDIRSMLTPDPAGGAEASATRQRLFSVHSIAGVLLKYLQELPDPVVPEEMYNYFINFIENGEVGSHGQRRTRLRDLVSDMPAVHQSTLRLLLAHFSRLIRWQSESGVAVSYDMLIHVFAGVLLRPPWPKISELADNIKIHNDIVQELLREGCWGEAIPEIPKPTGFPAAPPAPQSNNRDFAPQGPRERLHDAPWYWGNISKEYVRELMKDTPDGTFLVRDATVPDEYTLSIKVNGTVALVRILYYNDRFGFAEPLEFPSVPTVIGWYQSNSLVSYNSKLDIKLRYPLIRAIIPLRPSGSVTQEMEEYLRFSHHMRKQRDLYSYLFDWNRWVALDLELKFQALGNYQVMLNLLKEQIERHRESPGTRANQEIYKLSICREQVESAEGSLLVEIQRQEGKQRLINGEQSIARLLVRQLDERCRQWKAWLSEHRVNEDFLDRLLNLHPSLWLVVCDRSEAESRLRGKPDGTFLIRPKEDGDTTHVLSIVYQRIIHHCRILRFEDGIGFSHHTRPFTDLQKLVECNGYKSLSEHNPQLDVCLLYPVHMQEPSGAAT